MAASKFQPQEENNNNKLLQVMEREVVIEFMPGAKCRADIHLHSLHSSAAVAFKVQTSSPQRFHVNPPSGLLPPLSSVVLRVILRPQSYPPPSFPRSPSDRFLIKASTNFATEDTKLKVAYVGPFLLHHAVSLGGAATVRNLLRRQKDIVAELSVNEAAALYNAASSLPDKEILNLLVEYGLLAAGGKEFRHGHEVEEVSDAEAKGDKGRGVARVAALHRAVAAGDVEVVERLMELGVDAGTTDARGRTAVDIARDMGHEEVVEILQRGEMILTAARRGDLKRLESLLKCRRQRAGAVRASDQYGMTALHVAAIKSHIEAVVLLIECGMDVDVVDVEGHTPLHLAVEGGAADVVELLVDMGADVNARSKRGATPLYMAQSMGHDAISKLLLSRGASSSSCVASSSSSSTS